MWTATVAKVRGATGPTHERREAGIGIRSAVLEELIGVVRGTGCAPPVDVAAGLAVRKATMTVAARPSRGYWRRAGAGTAEPDPEPSP